MGLLRFLLHKVDTSSLLLSSFSHCSTRRNCSRTYTLPLTRNWFNFFSFVIYPRMLFFFFATQQIFFPLFCAGESFFFSSISAGFSPCFSIPMWPLWCFTFSFLFSRRCLRPSPSSGSSSASLSVYRLLMVMLHLFLEGVSPPGTCLGSYPSPGRDSGSPPSGYVAIFMSCLHAGFCFSLLWLMMEFCVEIQIASGQFDLRAWGKIIVLQVLSDLTEIDISGEMIAMAFRARLLGVEFHRY